MSITENPGQRRQELLIAAISGIPDFENNPVRELFKMITNGTNFEGFRQQWNATFDLTDPDVDSDIEIQHVLVACDIAYGRKFPSLPEVVEPPASTVETGTIAPPATWEQSHPATTDTALPPEVQAGQKDELRRIQDKILLQEAAIITARTGFSTMKPYDRERAQTIANTLFYALLENAPTMIAEAKNQPFGLHKATQYADGSTCIDHQAFEHCLAEHRAPLANSLAIGNRVEKLVGALCINPDHHDEVANYLMGIPWPERRISGDALMMLAKQRGFSAEDVLRFSQFERRINQADHAAALGMTPGSYQTIYVDKSGSKPLKEALDNAAKKLGCTDTITIFRQLALGIDPESADSTLNAAIPAADQRLGDKMGRARQVYDFLDALRQAHGLRDNKELAQEIAAKTGCDAKMLQSACNDMSASKPELEAGVISRRPRKTMNEELGQAVARFAYPLDLERQAACIDFLTSRVIWAERHKFTINPQTSRGS